MLAQAYGYAGQKEKVLPLLDEAVGKRSNCLIFLRNDPRLEPIRQHPHFQVLLNRVGLDDLAVASYKK